MTTFTNPSQSDSRIRPIAMTSLPKTLRLWLASIAVAATGSLQCAEIQRNAGEARTTLPALRVHSGGHYLETTDGRPFFWLGDTAWSLIHGTTPEERGYYLRTRSQQGFTLIQAVVRAENFGAGDTSVDAVKPNEAYFDQVVQVVDEAAALGLYVALVPSWNGNVTSPWGGGPRIFRLDNLDYVRGYGRYLGARLKDRANVVWMLGGDRPSKLDPSKPAEWPQDTAIANGWALDTDWRPIWRAMAAGIAEGVGRTPVCIYHPEGARTSSPNLHHEAWLSINGMQSGHSIHDSPAWEWVLHDFALTPAKPTLDLEPCYEEHPVNPWPRWDPSLGRFNDHDVRKECYRSVLAGACGVTYGHHAIHGFSGARNGRSGGAGMNWIEGMHRPGGRQMVFLRRLIESRPFFTRLPDQSMIDNPSPAPAQFITVSRDLEGTYAFAYFPTSDQTATLDLAKLRPGKLRVWWFDPRTGFAHPADEIEGGARREFKSPSYGPDWVLVLDSASAGYSPPGQEPFPL